MAEETQVQEEVAGGDDLSFERALTGAIRRANGVDPNELLAELGRGADDYVRAAQERVKMRAAADQQEPLMRQYQAELKRMGGRTKNFDRVQGLRQKYRKLGLNI